VAAPGTAYGGMVGLSRSHKLAPLFSLIFRRSSLQHPLLVGALGECCSSPPAEALLLLLSTRTDPCTTTTMHTYMGLNTHTHT
jgi:hypothetical protein